MGTCNRHIQFGLKIPNRFGKNVRKFQGGYFFDSHCRSQTTCLPPAHKLIVLEYFIAFFLKIQKRDFMFLSDI